MALLIVSDVILGVSIYKNMQSTMEAQLKESASNLARCAANTLDGAVFDSLREKDSDSEEFAEVYDALTVFLENGGYDHLKASNESFIESTNQFVEMIQGFSSVGNEIYANVDLMKDSTEQINQTIEYTANGLHNIATKSLQVTDSMKEIEAQADTSSKVSYALYEEVDKFKVE
ncbi:MAG: hypothetical protein IJ661_08315 [Lachnospiraceae bacterium]|nr:hypothetical protein [Lachnospiraceae bacterium]